MVDPIVYELSNTCRCIATDDDGNELKDENGYPVGVDYCYGCWQDDLGNIEFDIIEPWKKANGISNSDYVIISVERATWLNVSGHGICNGEFKNIVNSVSLDGDDCTLKFTYDGDKTLTAQRWSHDEPTGTGIFTFRKATDDEVEDWQHR